MLVKNRPVIALAGCGVWGYNWVRVLKNLGLLGAVVDNRPAALVRVVSEYPGTRMELQLESILRDPQIEAVVIATPAVTHSQTARECLEAGKHVLVEKPMALSLAEGRELVALAERKKRILMVGHLFEHHPAVRRLVEFVRQGELGRLQYLYSNQLNIGTVRDQENALWSLAPHDVGLVLRVVGQMPLEIRAFGSAHLNPGIADLAVMHLKFPNEVAAHIFVDWLHPFKERRLVVVGDKQMAVFDDTQPWKNKLILYPHQIERVDGHPPRIIKQAGRPIDLPEHEPLQLEAEHFWECLQSGREPLTSGSANLRILEVLEEADLSLNPDIALGRENRGATDCCR